MSIEKVIEIPLSKRKLVLSFIGALAFVAIGILMLVTPTSSGYLAKMAGGAGVLFFGFVVIRLLPKLRDNKPGLVISDEGITDNSSAVSAGFIPWRDIESIKTTQVASQRFLILVVSNPETYINRITNPITKAMVKVNHSSYGSPISISSNALQANFEQLHQLLVERANRISI